MQLNNLGQVLVDGRAQPCRQSGKRGENGNIDLIRLLASTAQPWENQLYIHQETDVSYVAFLGVDQFFQNSASLKRAFYNGYVDNRGPIETRTVF